MKAAKKSKKQADLTAMVSELQDLAQKIRLQVDQEIVRLQQAQLLAAQESARLEALLVRMHSKSENFPQDSQPVPQAPDCRSALIDKHRRIYELSEQGLGPLEIAQQTGQSLGEIQVILALRKSE